MRYDPLAKRIIELIDENAALRARVAELEADKEKQREMFFKALKERPVAPHPVDQMANLHREMLKDAEAECKVLMASNAALTDEVLALRARVAELEAALAEAEAITKTIVPKPGQGVRLAIADAIAALQENIK